MGTVTGDRTHPNPRHRARGGVRAPPREGRRGRDLPGHRHRYHRGARRARGRRGAARPGRQPGPLVPMRELAPGTDRYGADVTVTGEGTWTFHVEAWSDPIAHWHHDAAIKIPRGQDVELMLAEGALLFERAARGDQAAAGRRPACRRPRRARRPGQQAARPLPAAVGPARRRRDAPDQRHPEPLPAARPGHQVGRMPVLVDRQRALFGSWYEFFPRSEGVQVDPMGRREPVSGTLRTAARRLEAIAEMGFDVVYLPPVHPIGTTFRKGRNNTLEAGPGDPGSPWAIGSADGGHDAIHPDLGTFADFDAFVARARELGMEVAIDLALKPRPTTRGPRSTRSGSPRGPTGRSPTRRTRRRSTRTSTRSTSTTIPRASTRRSTGSSGCGWTTACGSSGWTTRTPSRCKFWERLLADSPADRPDVLFLAEAFTRPAMMAPWPRSASTSRTRTSPGATPRTS